MKNIYKEKKVAVLGFGKSGYSVSKRLNSFGADVLLSETQEKDMFDPARINELESLGVKLEFCGHTDAVLEGTDIIILSPGISLDVPILQMAKTRNIPFISEVELAFSILKKPIIAVTGTNGKTTTSILIGEILKKAGKKVVVAGNVGYPISDVNDDALDFIVAEVSSYQLETIRDFKPFISVILNITEDHLLRHKTMKEYIRLKGRIFENQLKEDWLIYNSDDQSVAKLVLSSKSKLVSFSASRKLNKGFYVNSDKISFILNNEEEEIISKDQIYIKGQHNLENALAASAAAKLIGISTKVISESLKNFKGVSHRLEYVSTFTGISFYNDSKATNADSALVALKALKNKVVLIAGGKDKGGDLSKLINQAKTSVTSLVLLGESKKRFKKAFLDAGFVSVHEVSTMEEAVKKAHSLAVSGDKILLSPACASFDMFKNFEERGNVFKEQVKKLKRLICQ